MRIRLDTTPMSKQLIAKPARITQPAWATGLGRFNSALLMCVVPRTLETLVRSANVHSGAPHAAKLRCPSRQQPAAPCLFLVEADTAAATWMLLMLRVGNLPRKRGLPYHLLGHFDF